MYDPTDPRGAPAAPSTASQATEFAGADYLKFYHMRPTRRDPLAQAWYGRGQNFLVAYMQTDAGAVIARVAQPDEYAILLPDHGSEVIVQAGDQEETVGGYRIAFVPPGDSSIRVAKGGTVVLLFSHRAADIAALCANAAAYAAPQPNTAPFEPWPEPVGGFRIRSYSLSVPPTPGRFGRIFRCTTPPLSTKDSKYSVSVLCTAVTKQATGTPVYC